MFCPPYHSHDGGGWYADRSYVYGALECVCLSGCDAGPDDGIDPEFSCCGDGDDQLLAASCTAAHGLHAETGSNPHVEGWRYARGTTDAWPAS